jgi:hypothetical protein
MREVLAAKTVMRQSLLPATGPEAAGDEIARLTAALQRRMMVATLVGFGAVLVAIAAVIVALLR